MDNLISRQAAIDAIRAMQTYKLGAGDDMLLIDQAEAQTELMMLPSAQPEPHYCRECKWSRCQINIDKHGKSETYWRCLNWDGGTDEEGYCHEWERREDGEIKGEA